MRKIILLITMAVVLVSLIISPVTVTAANSDVAKSSVQLEKEINKLLSEYGIEDTGDVDKLSVEQQCRLAELLLQQAKLEAKEQEQLPMVGENDVTVISINSDSKNGKDSYRTLGSSTLNYANWGYANSGKSWFPVGIWDADYYTSSKRDESTVLIGPAGFGSAWARSEVGVKFKFINAPSIFPVDFNMQGYYEGALTAFVGAQAGIEMNLVVKDTVTGSKTSQTIIDEDTGVFALKEYHENFSNSVTVMIRNDRIYIVYLEVISTASIGGLAEAGSDFGHHDLDSGHAMYNTITLGW